MAMGKKEALKQGAAMGERQILSRNRPPTMGVHRRGREQKGETLTVHLYHAAQTRIRRHRLIQSEANPYDPAWEAYFDERIGLKWLQSWLKRRKLIALWNEQEGKCPICDQKITKESGWHVHHILYRVYGGTDNLSNLLLLHPNCHRQVHHQQLDVTKPGAETCLEEA